MSKLQYIDLPLFALLSAGSALGYRADCPGGSRVETYLLRGLGARLLGNDPCEQAAPRRRAFLDLTAPAYRAGKPPPTPSLAEAMGHQH